MSKYLDKDGLAHLWERVQELVATCGGGKETFTAKNIVAGDNVTVEVDGDNAIINALGGSGGGNKTYVIDGVCTSVSNGSPASVTYTASQLATYGITDLSKVAVVSVKQTNVNGSGYRYGNTFDTMSSGMSTFQNVAPIVTMNGTSLSITVYNPDEGTGTRDIEYEIVLMEKEQSGGEDFKILTCQIVDVNPTSTKMYMFTDEQLAEQGIADMLDYEVIAVSAKPTDRVSRVYLTHDVDASGKFTYPSVVYSRTGQSGVTQGLQISIYNVYSEAKSFDVRLVLMQVPTSR